MNTEKIKIIGYTASNNPYRATRDGKEYEELFPVPEWHEEILKRNGTVEQTVAEMRKVIRNYAWQTLKVSERLKGDSLYNTCKNIWNFLYNHIKYKEDDEGQEQLRTPALSWHVRQSRGIDCDDFSIFAGTILFNLNIPFFLRIAKYPENDFFSHVYVVVPHNEKRYICIDAVIDQYDAEKTPLKQYKDFKVMEKQFLGGVDIALLSGADENTDNSVESMVNGAWFPGRDEVNGIPSAEEELDAVYKHLIDTRDLIKTNPSLIKNNEDPESFLKMLDYAIQYWNTDKRDEALAVLEAKEQEINQLSGVGELPEDYEEHLLYYGVEGLSGISVLGKTKKVRAFFNKLKEAAQKVGQGIKTAFKQVIKYSPVTVGARAGMLLALKLNVGKMAEQLKWGFLTEQEAIKHGFDIVEWKKLRDKLKKSEHLFVDTMQGSAQHFKDAILTGRAGGLAGFPDDDLGIIEPVTASATLIATALPFIKKILDYLKDVDFKKLTAKVKVDLLKKAQKEAEKANPIPADVKSALPDNNVTPDTKIAAKPEAEASANLPTTTDKTETPAATDTPNPNETNFFSEAGNWIKDNPGKSLLITGALVLAVSSKARHAVGLGIVTGKGKRKGNKKNSLPKVINGAGKKKSHSKTGKKGKGGNHKTIRL